MLVTSLLTALAASTAALLVSAAPLEIVRKSFTPSLHERIVVNPPITFPMDPETAPTWYTGQKNVNITWDVPEEAKGYKGTLLLGYLEKNDSYNEHLFSKPLAEGFNLTDGRLVFNIPCDSNIKSRSTYIVVLMGDSGNKSGNFTIHRNVTACPNFAPKKAKATATTSIVTAAPTASSSTTIEETEESDEEDA